MNKEERRVLRREKLAERDRLPPSGLTEQSRAIAARVLSLPEMAGAKVVMIYMHFRSEVRTDELISGLYAMDKRICIPLTRPEESRLLAVRILDPARDVAPGYCGIPEPAPGLLAGFLQTPADIDVVIVPGAVFDQSGARLGYGGGYYDRFLSSDAPRAVRIALAFGLQVVDRVPVESHDQRMDMVVTEDNVYRCGRRRHAQDSGI